MDLIQAIVLALIQGVTEFLPISSSAHLILPSQVLAWPDQGLAFDVAVHVGSLLAVVIYFRKDLRQMGSALTAQFSGNATSAQSAQATLGWMVAVATLPTVAAGVLGHAFIEQHLRSAQVIAATTILFGLLLGLAESHCRRAKRYLQISWSIALIVGLAQVLALVPGTSRSGITMTVAVLLGLSRGDAARFSFLLSIPIIFAAGALSAVQLMQAQTVVNYTELAIGMVVSMLSAWLCISLFLQLIERIGFMPFVWYRMILGLVLIAFVV
jgi:undecaprenyl-diphosphatase